jgi:hypothetical protein
VEKQTLTGIQAYRRIAETLLGVDPTTVQHKKKNKQVLDQMIDFTTVS